MNNNTARDFVNRRWDESIIPQLVEYVRIPNKSPMFDPDLGGPRPHGSRRAAMRRWAEQEAGRCPARRWRSSGWLGARPC